MDVLEPYLSASERAALEPLGDRRRVNRRTGQISYHAGERKYERRLGGPAARPADPHAYMGAYSGAHKGRDPDPRVDHDPAARIADMDSEGVDVNLLLPSGWFGTWTTVEDTGQELALYRAYHRWMADYCSAYPDRLSGVILVSGRDVPGSLAEVERCAAQPWALALFCYAPYGMPLDPGRPRSITTWRSCSTRSRSCRRTRPEVWIRGTTSGSSARPRIPGAGCATWPRSSAP